MHIGIHICRMLAVLILGSLNWAQADDWPVHSGDKQGTRYSQLKQITPDNVDDLEVAWRYRTGEKERAAATSRLNGVKIKAFLCWLPVI